MKTRFQGKRIGCPVTGERESFVLEDANYILFEKVETLKKL